MDATFVVVGGGIAGVTCVETLAFFEPHDSIVLISESSLIKTVTNLHAITRTLTQFDIEEHTSDYLKAKHSNITIVHDRLTHVDDVEQFVQTSGGKVFRYKYLCLCLGAQPKLIPQSEQFAQVLGIRDTDSVEHLLEKLKSCKSVTVVGNGGIASELVYKLSNIDIHWVVKDKHISATFVDPGAAEFFQPSLHSVQSPHEAVVKRMRYSEDNSQKSGAALGPDWYKNLTITGHGDTNLTIHYESEISHLDPGSDSSEIRATLTNGKQINCDIIVSATGVSPTTNFTTRNDPDKSPDGGLQVNDLLQTSLPNIYAAGDVCNANWDMAKHWFPMKLWTQARQMGCYAAKSMFGHHKNEVVLQDFCFEMFAHSTKLFGYKVILLGLYNGQKLGRDYEILLRMTKDKEYVKFVLQDNRLQGAVLIGDTDLEEMCENLILNQLDLSPYGDDILNPDIDIEDYFD